MMSLEGLEDWDKSKQRFEAWWHGEVIDRPLLQVIAPRREACSEPMPTYQTQEERWLDPEYRLRMMEWELKRTCYAGDAFPYLDTHIGPGTLSLYLGAIPEFTDRTVWYRKCISDFRNAQPPVFDENNLYWQASLRIAREGVKRLKGRALVSFPDLIENLDTISSLVGNNELLFALVDCPDKVREFQNAILPVYLECHRRLYEIIKDEDGGSCFSAFRIYGKGRIAKLQCDFSAMISPRMFEEFAVPWLAEQCRQLDHCVYHWDGPCALQHEGPLLAIKELEAIQWTPGAGQPGCGDRMWFPLYRRIRKAGKSLMLLGVTPTEAQELVEEFGPEGLDLVVYVETEEEAHDLVRASFSWRRKS